MKIALLGDVALFGQNTVVNKECYTRYLPIKEELDKCDYVIANLETPLTSCNKTVKGKSAYLKGSIADVEILEYLNITHVTLANNHMYDYNKQGLQETIEVLESKGIEWYGVNDKSVVIKDVNNSIALLGYCCYSTNGKGFENSCPFINVLDPVKVELDINKAIKRGFYPIVSMHWGQEHVHYPNYDHIKMARKICKGKKLTIHGHHPHVIQGIDYFEGCLIAYSLGNFCFDDIYTGKSKHPLVKLSKDNQNSFILIIELNNNEVSDYKCVPFSFEYGVYRISYDLLERIIEWSDFINEPEEKYNSIRLKDLTNYLNNRKKLRDLEWYIKRLNLESARIMLAGRHNMKMYNKLVKKYISE